MLSLSHRRTARHGNSCAVERMCVCTGRESSSARRLPSVTSTNNNNNLLHHHNPKTLPIFFFLVSHMSQSHVAVTGMHVYLEICNGYIPPWHVEPKAGMGCEISSPVRVRLTSPTCVAERLAGKPEALSVTTAPHLLDHPHFRSALFTGLRVSIASLVIPSGQSLRASRH